MPSTIVYKLIGGLVAVLMLVILIQNRNHWKAKATELQTQINQAHDEAKNAEDAVAKLVKQLKDKSDEKNRRIAADARTLSVSGPGKAACHPAPVATGHGAGPAKPDAPRPALPPDDRAAVPWPWLVQRAQEHDQLLNEVNAWRTGHEEVLKVWPKPSK